MGSVSFYLLYLILLSMFLCAQYSTPQPPDAVNIDRMKANANVQRKSPLEKTICYEHCVFLDLPALGWARRMKAPAAVAGCGAKMPAACVGRPDIWRWLAHAARGGVFFSRADSADLHSGRLPNRGTGLTLRREFGAVPVAPVISSRLALPIVNENWPCQRQQGRRESLPVPRGQ